MRSVLVISMAAVVLVGCAWSRPRVHAERGGVPEGRSSHGSSSSKQERAPQKERHETIPEGEKGTKSQQAAMHRDGAPSLKQGAPYVLRKVGTMLTEAAHVAISPDCSLVAAGGRYRETAVWNMRDGRLRWRIPDRITKQYIDLLPDSRLGERAIPSFVPGGTDLFSAMDGDTVRIIDIAGRIGPFRGGFLGPILAFGVLPSGRRVAALYPDRVAVWKLPAGLVYNVERRGFVAMFVRRGRLMLVHSDGSVWEMSMEDGSLQRIGNVGVSVASTRDVHAVWDGQGWVLCGRALGGRVVDVTGRTVMEVPKGITVVGCVDRKRVLVEHAGVLAVLEAGDEGAVLHPVRSGKGDLKIRPSVPFSFATRSSCIAIGLGRTVYVAALF